MAQRSSGAGSIVILGLLVMLGSMCHRDPDRRPAQSEQSVAYAYSEVRPLPPSDAHVAIDTEFVSTKSLNQRSSPNGPVVGRLVRGDRVEIYERRGDWVRVSAPEKAEQWVSSKLLCSGVGCHLPSTHNPGTSKARPAPTNVTSCPCSGSRVCIGPRGGRYCITSGGNKRYGV